MRGLPSARVRTTLHGLAQAAHLSGASRRATLFDIIRPCADSTTGAHCHDASQHRFQLKLDAKLTLKFFGVRIKKRRVRGKSLAALKEANTGEVVRRTR